MINAIDFNSDGTKFVTGGHDTVLRIYDAGKKSTPTVLEGGVVTNHKNRIYCVKFLSDNPNLVKLTSIIIKFYHYNL